MLCHFAHQFPPFVANFLESSRDLGRRFREETITDMMMAALQLIGGDRVIVRFPNEPKTGADMEWNFVNPYDGTFYRLIIQAKCAYGYGSDWTRHSYRYLSHRTGNKFQADVLCDEARQSTQPTYPLYIFYNPAHTCSLAGHSGCSSIEGVNLANGYLIRSLATTGQRRLSTIRHYVLNLSDLLCQPANESEIPRPVDVRNCLLFNSRTSFSYPEQILREMGIVVPPNVGTSIPDDIQAIIDRSPREREPRPFSGWRVIFISSSPPERTRE